MPTVAVVTPTRNMADTLWVSLGSACRAGADEIVVIDDASEDHTPAVVGLWQSRYPQIKYIRHDTKLPDHNAAQREVYASLKSDHVIGLSADDCLLSEAIHFIKQNAHAPLVFTAVDVVREDGMYLGTDVSAFDGDVSPDEISARFRSDANATECGIASSVRRDIMEWLWSLNWEALGPCMDSVGYGTAACLHGAHYVRRRCGVYTQKERSYGNNPDWGEDYFIDLAKKSIDFMHRAGLDRETAAAICKKRCRVEVAWED